MLLVPALTALALFAAFMQQANIEEINVANPTILAGDFNSRPGDPVMRALGRRYVIVPKNGSSFTFPSTGPNREIDYLLIRRDAPLQARSCRVLDERVASDHRPLLTDLAWTERDEP